MRAAVYIDDTASASQTTNSKYLTEDRRTYVAVIFTEEERKEADEQLKGCIEEINIQFAADEFHFTDIYSGTKKFKGIDIDIRLSLFRVFVYIYNQYRWPIIIQTVNDRTLLEHGIRMVDIRAEGFNFADNSDVALFMLLIQCKNYLQDNIKKYDLPVDFVIDAGKQKADTFQKVSLLSGVSVNSALSYKSSHDDVLIQIADFIAFCVNRIQMIAVKENKSRVDKEFLKIMSDMKFNGIGFEMVPMKKVNSLEYDRKIRSDKDIKRIVSDEGYKLIKELMNDFENYISKSE